MDPYVSLKKSKDLHGPAGQEIFLMGVQLQTKVGPTQFYHFKTHTIENREWDRFLEKLIIVHITNHDTVCFFNLILFMAFGNPDRFYPILFMAFGNPEVTEVNKNTAVSFVH